MVREDWIDAADRAPEDMIDPAEMAPEDRIDAAKMDRSSGDSSASISRLIYHEGIAFNPPDCSIYLIFARAV